MSFDFDTIHSRLGTGSTKWSRYPEDVLPMWIADMDIAAPPAVLQALRERLDQQILGYSVAGPQVRQAIVDELWAKYAWRVLPEELLFLPGVEPGFNMALHAFVQPGQAVVLQTPNYRPIRLAPGHWNLPRIEVPFAFENGEYLTPLPAMRQALNGAGALLLSNPHNPIGKVFPREELLAVANACLDNGALIISDEIHAELCFDGRRHIPTASLSPAIAQRTITLMSASKAYNVAGLKTCFAVIQNAEIRERFNNARCGMVDSVSPLGLEATRAAYSQCGEWLDALLAYLQANRDYLMTAVRSRLPGVVMHAPQGTFLAWLDCSALGLEDPQQFFLEQAKVGLSAGIEFGDDSQQFVRLNFGCPRAMLEEGLQRMERALRER
ncbi:pyridoxal phosphate-dependent aminotransferase [Pseudomonas sp. S1Bt30]|uniref:cysteine-S-conjugate beta-lyase n=1 Tax=Pseudomonas quebecensis TaxID=2995174 RepID=A0ABY6QMI3_9PSED|nr:MULTISPECIES: MalY/PatB family protein [Pseudomonas]MCX4067211.1 pyridoxal phosphate-dependent aminotransferase [Pseudomonas quebecensis]UZW21202.1 pyridoxal phosphate-dependent aminotransferase [Pseudomonas quebecensis]UZW26271.1 pyridoxal phosphate-dependent aminotransferase [Pseudomonas quebecensis]UZW31333.1 pyridoxal phosphate-dependent aminotransferase [Pseudomonas quebecensis]